MIDVLVVDDDFRVAGLHADTVAQVPGFRVVAQVHTAAAALDAVQRHRPALVLLDLYLPDAHGLEVLRRLALLADPPPPDAIVISAARDRPSVRAAMRLGAAQVLVKPFDLALLRERLASYAELHAAQHAGGDLDQAAIDRMYGILGRAAAQAGARPPGAASPTTRRILEALRGAPDGLGAGEVARRLGVSRATAQRHLAALVEGGDAELSLRYGVTGRPEHRYRLTGAGGAG